jgi:hypothetical protein
MRCDRRSLVQYVTVCVLNEHFLAFRQVVRRHIDAQLDALACSTEPRTEEARSGLPG